MILDKVEHGCPCVGQSWPTTTAESRCSYRGQICVYASEDDGGCDLHDCAGTSRMVFGTLPPGCRNGAFAKVARLRTAFGPSPCDLLIAFSSSAALATSGDMFVD